MHILIVDDNADVVELLALFLADRGEIDTARDGHEAIKRVRAAFQGEAPYDLICMDIKMPGKNGREAVSDIRAIERAHGIAMGDGAKIVMTTAMRDRSNVMGSFWKEGCDAYLIKPFSRNDLLDILKKLELTPA